MTTKKLYPVLNYKIWMLLTISLFALIGGICLLALMEAALPGMIIAGLTFLTLAVIPSVTASRMIKRNSELRDSTITNIGPVWIIDHANLSIQDKKDICSVCYPEFLEDLVSELTDSVVYSGLDKKYYPKVKTLKPVTQCYVKVKGSVRFQWGTADKIVAGLAYGHETETEWRGDLAVWTSLFKHEVSHVLFNGTAARDNTGLQHKLMSVKGF